MNSSKHKSLSDYQQTVGLKYQLYNSIFLKLPLGGIKDVGVLIPILTDICRDKLSRGESPKQIVETFLKEQFINKNEADHFDYLFRVIQFIERQVVLIDALEDATFEALNNLDGDGSLADLFFRTNGENKKDILEKSLNQFSIRPVLTAHPTQFYPGRVLAIITDLTDAIANNDVDLIHTYLMQLGMTPFFKKKKPSPYDEAVNLTWYLQNIFYSSAGNIVTSLRKYLLKEPGAIQSIQLGFWPGGDRDGNPFVNTTITLDVARRLKETILKCYYTDIRAIRRRISFSGIYEHLLKIEKKILKCIRGYDSWSAPELLIELHSILNDINTHHNGVFKEIIEDYIDRVSLFGFHFATLDFRQDSSIIRETIKYLLPDSDEKSTAEALFSSNLLTSIPKAPNDRIDDTLQSFKTMKNIQETNGEKGSHRYIISNCQSDKDVASVFYIAKQTTFQNEPIPVDFIPLFETINDLNNAEQIMTTLLCNEDYLDHLSQRGNKQTVMLGFSDGTKDGGYLSANWNIYKVREQLSDLSKKGGIKIIFFDGRGGPPARGGGNTHNYYASLGSKIASTEIQLTVQGQTISSKFGTKESAKLNLEQLLTAGLDNLLFEDKHKKLTSENHALLEHMSTTALRTYTDLKDHPLFTSFLVDMSPLKYYSRTNIGSRPDKRNESNKVEFQQLRAIPFVGAWSQIKQNIPGFYGLGTALKEMEDSGKLNDIIQLYSESRFFRALIGNSMQSMCKTYFPLTDYMKHDRTYGEFWSRLKEEYDLTERLILTISGQKELLQNNQNIKESIALREETVLPLLVIQQYALMRLRENDLNEKQKQTLEKIIIRTLFGNINASRNSA
ncbi:MAG: phosphoenolpyruvate carboxylase [Candidatus Marinimicrobia bacterium]|nr:phosphoenolpyruvate carboxylase [Candidatus Neomarinimicrobiota bacterium]MBT4636338.1 phosphoenolpyruvate carboxylase [Candidatus Neomarinimicrobiota bacterium]MBT4684793.1 phosphoenolpyruvate carboxylase [Candidatus Neomarinimicrobiota bacterium]MBT4736404.1 phosphoenolpyruvate carboxylase [Candidatus Neomarinimicrobiota bacterium]MBT5069652.1 phosphoenolpyruvate carboxylase [Candidatus Neomarinimicrobiota bacterium]